MKQVIPILAVFCMALLIIAGCTNPVEPDATPSLVEQPTTLATSSPTPEPPTVVETTATAVPKVTTQKPSSTTSSAKFSFTEYVELVEDGRYEHGVFLRNDGTEPITAVMLEYSTNDGRHGSNAFGGIIAPGEQVKLEYHDGHIESNPEKVGFEVKAR